MPRRLPPGIRERTLPGGRKRWDVRTEFPPDPRTGERRTDSKTFADQKDAEAYQRKQLTDRDEGTVITPDRLTVGELLERWLEQEATHRVRPTTLQGYTATVRAHLLPHIGHKRSQSLLPADVAALRSTLLQQTGIRTTQLALLRLKQALAWGVSLELLKRNVAAGITPPASATAEKRALTHAEARAFLEIAATGPYAPIWRVYLATGLRRGEALGLRWKDLDLHHGVLSVRQQVVLAGKPTRPHIQEPKSPAARRSLDIDPGTLDALTVHHVRHVEMRQRVQLWQDHDLVFCTRNGFPLDPNHVRRAFNRLRDDAGLDPDFTIHALRHTHATHLLLAGIPIEVVSQRLGHANAAITLAVYSHLLPGYGGAALAAIQAALDGGVPELGG